MVVLKSEYKRPLPGLDAENFMVSNLDCIRKLEVKQPEIRDKLLSIIKEELYDDEVVLVIHYLRN